MPFRDADGQFGDIATEELQRKLSASKRFVFLERERIAEVMRAIAQSQERDFDPKTAIEVGRLLVAQYVCFGTVSSSVVSTQLNYHVHLRAIVRVAMRIVRVEDGSILFDEATTGVKEGWANVTSHEILSAGAVQSAAVELVRRFENSFPTEGTIVELRDERTVLLDLGVRDGMKKGLRLTVVRRSSALANPATGQFVIPPDEEIGEIEVTRAGESASYARIRKGKLMPGDLVRTKPRDRSSWDW